MAHNRIKTLAGARIAAVVLLACSTTACGGDDGPSGGSSGGTPTPTITPAPTPTPTPETYATTPVPFGLTSSLEFDVFGWQAGPVPSTFRLRWNSTAKEYEVLFAPLTEWARMRRLNAPAGGVTVYDVFRSDGSLAPFDVIVEVPTAPDFLPYRYVGVAYAFDGDSYESSVAFGTATTPANMPASGTKTCNFGLDEVGDGTLQVNFATGAVSGSVQWFYASMPYSVENATYSSSNDPAIEATYRNIAANTLEAQFFGPNAENIAVRLAGDITGIMIGACS